MVTVFLVVLSLNAGAQQNAFKPTMSGAPLTKDQIAIYRTVLRDYLKGSHGALNLADVTEQIDQSDKACFSGVDAATAKDSPSVIHRIDRSVVTSKKIVLVDPGSQQKAIEENDPQKLVKMAIDGRKVTDEQVGESVDRAIASGLFQLSEIVFDKDHRQAVVSFSFVCGGLCGNGSTLVFKKVGRGWKVTMRCGEWVS